jgi:hypothetical protein
MQRWMLLLAMLLSLTGCVMAPYDYTNYRSHPPRSILVLPPLNETTSIEATYSYLSTVSKPLAELGYYVFPVAVIDTLFKDNGMPTPYEMHQVSLQKVTEITGADAVLFITIKEYGTKYRLIDLDTRVNAAVRLVDTRTEALLWEGHSEAGKSSADSGSLTLKLISAAIGKATQANNDPAHSLSRQANEELFARRSVFNKATLPPGPYVAAKP